YTEPAKEGHRHSFPDHRRIGGQVVEHERAHAEELAARAVVREVHFETRLHAAAAAEPARSDPHVAHADAVPGDVGGVEVVAGEVHAQRFPVARVHRDL